MIFYFDKKIELLERQFKWDSALIYLEEKFNTNFSVEILNSLIGFSWYYTVEGPLESKKYELDECQYGILFWKKYIDFGIKEEIDNPFFYFIAGYTLCLHGFLIDQKYGRNYENLGIALMRKCIILSVGSSINRIATHFVNMHGAKKYIPLEIDIDDLKKIFSSNSLLEKYFIEIYSNK